MSPERPERPEHPDRPEPTEPTDATEPTEPTATAAEEAAVRRLLGEARVEGPVPAAVAARLEATLADLHAEQVDAGASGAVSLDAARRRRRRAGAMLLAAAVVVVGGFGVGQIVDTQPDDDGAGGAASSAEAPERGTGDLDADEDGAGDAAKPSEPYSMNQAPRADPGDDVAELASTPRLRQTRFAKDVQAVRAQLEGGAEGLDGSEDGEDRLQRSRTNCAPADWGEGELVAVSYRGHPAVLAFREPAGNSQVVDLMRCGSAEVIRSTTLPSG